MRFQLVEKKTPPMLGLWRGLWLAALICALLSLVDSLQYFYAVLPGVAIVIAAGFLSWKWQKVAGVVSFAICAIWLTLRLVPIGDGLGFLANRLFDLSAEGQDYYYDHFNVVRNAPGESLFFVTCALSAICLLLGNGMNLALTLLLAVMIAYFGVAPGIVWLSILIFAAFANALPKKGRWLPAILIAAFVAATAISAQTIAPEPNVKISEFAEHFWELLMPEDAPESVEPPTEPTEPPDIPEDSEIPDASELPEDFELPDDFEISDKPGMQDNLQPTVIPPAPQAPQPEEPVGGQPQKESKKKIPVLPILAVLLSLVSIGGIWMVYIGKKRKRNRADMYVQNNAAAIRGMYLYARRWRKLHDCPEDIPPKVEAIWLEAAYSEHEMTDAQLETMRSFVAYSAADTWNTLAWWERLVVYFYHAL